MILLMNFVSCIKANIDYSSFRLMSMVASGGIFRDYQTNYWECFSSNLGQHCAFMEVFENIMKEIEITNDKKW